MCVYTLIALMPDSLQLSEIQLQSVIVGSYPLVYDRDSMLSLCLLHISTLVVSQGAERDVLHGSITR